MKYPTVKELTLAVVQFLAMEAEDQVRYARGLPEEPFDFELQHSPLVEFAHGTYNLPRIFMEEVGEGSEGWERLSELEALMELMQCANSPVYWTVTALREEVEWRLARRLSRDCLKALGCTTTTPCIEYGELISQIMD